MPTALRPERPPGAAAIMRLITIILLLAMTALGVLAADHAQVVQSEAGHTVVSGLDTINLQLAAGDAASPESSSEVIAVGLVTGCITLIVCCALGLAMLAGRAWRADLSRRLFTLARHLRAAIIGATTPTTKLTSVLRPSLVALSISRT